MTKFIISHAGKQHSYHVARSLDRLGVLRRFYTSSYVKSSFLQQVVSSFDNPFQRRFLPGLTGGKIQSNWRFEIPELIWRRIKGKTKQVQDLVYRRDMLFDRHVAKSLQSESFTHFWGFQGSAFASLKQANYLQKVSILELSTAHVTAAQHILGEEEKLHPEWADSIDHLNFPSEYQIRLEQEPFLADKVIVASEFTRNSLLEAGLERSRITKLILGFDASSIPYAERTTFPSTCRVLYAGTVTQRKGIKYALEALRAIKSQKVTLDIIGSIQGSGKALAAYDSIFDYKGSLSQQALFNTYSNYDLLVLPTIFEGFGLVIIEAMAAGLPVITTSHSIGGEIIEHERDGYVVPIRSVEAIQEAILHYLGLSKQDKFQMRHSAFKKAMAFSWGAYEKHLASLIDREL